MPVKLLFEHGWGFDSGFWSRLRAQFPDIASVTVDQGYFGPARPWTADEPVLVVAHSLGAMRVLANPSARYAGLVAINGFDCFAAQPDFPGVPPRVIDRMLSRFDSAAGQVVADFRRRCGVDAPFAAPHAQRLREDLLALRDLDGRETSARWRAPFLALHGGNDPLLPLAMRAALFARIPHAVHAVQPEAGHVLPLSDPAWCASHIRRMVERCS